MSNSNYKDREEVLKTKIEQGASLSDVALLFGKSKSTIKRWADSYGLKFKGKSNWYR
tara:strand:+ start:940 stop:1110 length:171 start_codon:yes stop_codon:yes gene_type:complete